MNDDNCARSEPSASTLFVSYRRTDAFAVDQLVQSLAYRFGERRIVQDTLAFTPGASFPDEISAAVLACDLLVVVIGPQWAGPDGKAFLEGEGDWVRHEVELGLANGRPVLPVLLAGAPMPRTDQLSDGMQLLLARNALTLRTGSDASGDLRRIVGAASQHLPRDWRRLGAEMACIAAVMAILGLAAALGGAHLVFTDYAPWQWPNVMLGIAASLSAPAIALAEHLGRLWSARWRRPQPVWRQWNILAAAAVGIAVAAITVVLPQGNMPIDALYASLESTRQEIPRVETLLAEVRAMPRYATSDDVALAAQVVVVRKSPTLTEDGVVRSLNALQPFIDSPDRRRKLWAMLMVAETYRFIDQHDKQLALYRQVANANDATSWQRWYAWQEVGTISYQHKSDRATARMAWDEAIRFRATVGLLQNMAELDIDDGQWDAAMKRFVRAEQILKDYKQTKKMATLGDQEANLHTNWCNTLRRRAMQPGQATASFREDAAKHCRTAIAAYSAFLDAHWNLARIQLDAGDYEGARKTLVTCLARIRELARSDPPALARHGYNTYGEQYTIWLLVSTQFRAGKPLLADPALADEFQRNLVQLNPSASEAVSALLQKMENRELTVGEDHSLLDEMKDIRYL